jgi:hypothetical protein
MPELQNISLEGLKAGVFLLLSFENKTEMIMSNPQKLALGPLVLCKNVNNNSEMPSVFVPNSQ